MLPFFYSWQTSQNYRSIMAHSPSRSGLRLSPVFWQYSQWTTGVMADKTIFLNLYIMVFLLSKISPSKVIIVVICKSGGRLCDAQLL